MKFKNHLILASIFSLAILLSVATVSAQVQSINQTLEPVSCFAEGLYKFQSVIINAGPEESAYDVGETVSFVGEITNTNEYAVVDGSVFVRISKTNPDYITEGNDVIDEIIAVSDVAIAASSTLPISFSWKVPNDVASGEYQADFFFSVGSRFNLGGLPFTNEIIVGLSTFDIEGYDNSGFEFNRSETTVNDIPYQHIGEWPIFSVDESVEIVQPIQNFTSEDMKVSIKYDLYFWDSLREEDRIDSKTETIIIPANSSADASYTIEKQTESVYYLRMEASNGNHSSIVNIRTSNDLSRARINYPAVTGFPLQEGEEVTLFSCFHTTNDVLQNMTVSLELTDLNGDVVASGEYTGDITGGMEAASMKFNAQNDYTFLSLKAEISDENGNIVESYETEYDCSVLNSQECLILENEVESDELFYPILIVTILVIILLISARFIPRDDVKKVLYGAALIITIVSIISAVTILTAEPKVIEAAVSSDGQSLTKSTARGINFHWGWDAASGAERLVASGGLTVTKIVTLVGDTVLEIGDKFDLKASTNCTFNAYGQRWDTPYCSQNENIYDSANGNIGWLRFSPVDDGAPWVRSGDNSILTCSGYNCKAVGPGVTTVTYYLQRVRTQAIGCITMKDGQICHNGGARGRSMRLSYSQSGFNQKYLYPGSYQFTWTITVTDPVPPTPVNGTCGTADGSLVIVPPTGTQLCQSGNLDSLVDNGNNHYTWSCLGLDGGSDDLSCETAILTPVDGQCRYTPGTVVTSQLSVNSSLCTAGTPFSFNASTGGGGIITYTWGCGGINGGGDDPSCGALYDPDNPNNRAFRGGGGGGGGIDFGGGDYIDFNIQINIADVVTNQCTAEWTIKDEEGWTCELLNLGNNVVNGLNNIQTSGSTDVDSSNEYRLDCSRDSYVTVYETQLEACIGNPDIIEN